MIGRTSVVANDIAVGFAVMSAGIGGAVAGAKLAQMIARGGGQFAQNPSEFLSYARDFVVDASKEGTYEVANQIGQAGATIYKNGNDFLVVASSGRILSYVPNATPGVGAVTAYYQAGGK